jgi:Gpi18-like mannosyltransferase
MKSLLLKFIQITLIFLVSKLIILLTIHFFSVGPFSLITDHKDAPYNFITSIKKALTGWDSGWYKNIVEHGYSYTENIKEQQNVAFYFGYPITSKLVSQAFNLKADWALILVNNAAVFFGLFFMYYLGRLLGLKDNVNFIGITLYCLNPFAIFLTAGYSEGMYFLISAMALVLLIKRKYLPAAIVGGLLSGIRSIGIFYAPILFIHYFFIEKNKFNKKNIFTSIILLAFSVWGKAAFMLYNLVSFGDAFASEKVQEYWGNIGGDITLSQRFSNLYDYILIPFKNHFDLLNKMYPIE